MMFQAPHVDSRILAVYGDCNKGYNSVDKVTGQRNEISSKPVYLR